MGGVRIEDKRDLTESSIVRNLVLVGKTGNGKSATGNSILGRKAFISMPGPSGVTSTCEMQETVLRNGLKLNVIDTPGLFDFTLETKYVCDEIFNCIRMAKIGIHAVIVVFSVRTRFSEEEKVVFDCLRSFFGPKLDKYMIILFTGGDDLEDAGRSLKEYIGHACPEPMQEILQSCENRLLLFNNKTNNQSMNDEQVQQLLSLVEKIMEENGGQPYSDEFFTELNEGVQMLHDQEGSNQESSFRSEEELFSRIIELIEQKLGETIKRLEQELREEKAARIRAAELSQKQLAEEKAARLVTTILLQMQLDDEKKERLKAERHAKQLEEGRSKAGGETKPNKSSTCSIL